MSVRLLLVSVFFVLAGSCFAADRVAVMIHGAGGGGWEYKFWKDEFEKAGWKVIAPDLVPSVNGLTETQFSDYLNQVVYWTQQEKPKKLVLIGASMGGILVLKAAEKVHADAVVLVNGAPPKGYREPKADAWPDVVRWANGPIKDTTDAMPDSDEATQQFAWKKWRDESGKVLNEIGRGIEAAQPKAPTLFVLSEKDTDIPPRINLKLAEDYHADVQWYGGMSHVGPLLSTRAKEVAQGVLRWLAERLR